MHEKHPGVQDMASETFLKLSKLVKQMFVTLNDKEKEPHINVLIATLPENVRDLEPHQIFKVYEGIGWMISAQEDPQIRVQLICSLLNYSNTEFGQILAQGNIDMNSLMQQ